MWREHWRLSFDPFQPGPQTPFVGVPGHQEALARVLDAIENGQRQALVRGERGIGKSLMLTKALESSRSPSRRFARVSCPPDTTTLFALIATRLGRPTRPEAGRAAAWKALQDALLLCRIQRQHAVVIVDDADELLAPEPRADLERLVRADTHGTSRLSVILACEGHRESDGDWNFPWLLDIRIPSLTRSDVARYLIEKLAAAGRTVPTFSPRAINALYQRTRGVPRGLDRLASLALMAGTVSHAEVVSEMVVEGVSRECLGTMPEFAA